MENPADTSAVSPPSDPSDFDSTIPDAGAMDGASQGDPADPAPSQVQDPDAQQQRQGNPAEGVGDLNRAYQREIQNVQQLTATLRKQLAAASGGDANASAKAALTKSRLQEAIGRLNDNVMDQPKHLRTIAQETDAQFTSHQQQMQALAQQQQRMEAELEAVTMQRISGEFDAANPELKGRFTEIYGAAEKYADSLLDRNDPNQVKAWNQLANSTYRGLVTMAKTESQAKPRVTGTQAAPLPVKTPTRTQPVGKVQQAKPSAPAPKTSEDFLSMLVPNI